MGKVLQNKKGNHTNISKQMNNIWKAVVMSCPVPMTSTVTGMICAKSQMAVNVSMENVYWTCPVLMTSAVSGMICAKSQMAVNVSMEIVYWGDESRAPGCGC